MFHHRSAFALDGFVNRLCTHRRYANFGTIMAAVALTFLVAAHALANPPYDPYVAAGVDDATLRAIETDHADRLWAVGDRGLILATADAGRTWNRQDSGTTANLYGVVFIELQVGIVVGGNVGSRSGMSHGVVLRTRNGGETWEPVPEMGLPRLTGVRNVGGRLFAWGDYSTQHRTSLFTSTDGQQWQPVPNPLVHMAGLAGQPNGNLLAVDRVGNAFHSRMPTSAYFATSPQRPIRFVTNSGTHWLAGGFGGQLLRTLDGRAWASVPLPLSPEAQAACEWKTVGQFGEHLWVAGTPGSILLHSSDMGARWEVFVTEQNLPINAIVFADLQRGWAVGPMSTVLATRDGGRTWYSQRSGASRAGLLSMTDRSNTIPWPVLASASWDERVAVAAVTLYGHSLAQSADFQVEPWVANSDAAPQVGVANYDAWHFDVPQTSAQTAEVTRRLAIELLSWRPDVVLTSEISKQDSGVAPVPTLISSAMQIAASASEHGFIRELHLTPWKVSKLSTVTDTKRSQYAEIPARLLKAPGLAIADLLLPLDSFTDTVPLRTLEQSQHTMAGTNSLWGGVAPPTASRRTASIKNLGNYQLAMGRSARALSIDKLTQQSPETLEQDWAAQLELVVRALPKREIATAMMRVVDANGTPDLWYRRRMALEKILQLIPESDSATIARLKLLQMDGSDEVQAWANAFQKERVLASKSNGNSLVVQTNHPGTPFESGAVSLANRPDETSVVNASTTKPVGTNEQSDATPKPSTQARYDRFMATYAATVNADPSLASCPNVELMAHALIRSHRQEKGDVQSLNGLLERVAAASQLAGWPQVATAEMSLASKQSQNSRWIALARRAAAPPLLDGNFDDPAWSSAQVMELIAESAIEAPPGNLTPTPRTKVMWAYDDQYLYVAFECPRKSAAPLPPKRLRKYDSDLSSVDHIAITLDTDRDYNTAIELGISEEGETFDRCASISAFNPKWSVAIGNGSPQISDSADPSSTFWRAEVAIRFSQLTTVPRLDGNAWAITLFRRDKTGIRESWSQMKTDSALPQSSGFLLFEP